MLRFLMNELLTDLMLIRIYIIPILDAVRTLLYSVLVPLAQNFNSFLRDIVYKLSHLYNCASSWLS